MCHFKRPMLRGLFFPSLRAVTLNTNVRCLSKTNGCCAFFFQGLTLARPEIVPFRLTPSMVDGMGLCGFEGVYRRVMETCMSVLRTNRETLLSVLEPFLQARIH